MARIIIFDTETTGLPKSRWTSALDRAGNWPDIVSICWHVYEGTTLIKKEYYIVRPDGWTIPADSTKIHGITTQAALDAGSPLASVLGIFAKDINGCHRIVAHNMAFDKNVVLGAFKWRLGVNPMGFWPTAADFCSAEVAKGEMKMKSLYPKPGDLYKMPKLDELYRDTFGIDAPSDAHNAKRDVEVLEQIYFTRWGGGMQSLGGMQASPLNPLH